MTDKEGIIILSSMHRKAGLFVLLAASAPAALAAQNEGLVQETGQRAPAPGAYSPAAANIAQWNAVRQSDSLPFSTYAAFLSRNRGWPGEAALRRTAERRLSLEPVPPGDVVRFFADSAPATAGGHAQLAFALQAIGRRDEARTAARRAWITGAMAQADEQRLLAAFGRDFSPGDHDARLEALLGNGDTTSAGRALAWARPDRRPLFEARLALQTRSPDANALAAALDPSTARDPGLIIDRANWLRNSGQSASARLLLANRPRLDRPPANPARWLDTSLTLARAAANDRNWQIAYGIASRLEDLYAPGVDVSERPYDERDDYTSLVWLGGQAALFRLNRPADAARLFELYGRAARSPQTRAKGFYWASRAAAAAGRAAEAQRFLEQAADSPDQFYGQLALERLGRSAPPPPTPLPVSAAERAAFAQRPMVEAIRYLGTLGRRGDQSLFIRALAGTLRNDRERAIAGEFGRQIGRLDMGVWASREARSSGETFYARPAFPEVPMPPVYASQWSFAHAITRQESSFERTAQSPVGARGLMQLMPGTAAMQARRLGVPYSLARLTEDPAYNILLGNDHIALLMRQYGNNPVLVAAAYNAGGGNVNRWIAANGDPRLPGTDVVRWIEDIPFTETRNYVQRVLENMVVYDTIDPNGGGAGRGRLSQYLGMRPGN
jgi:soluble lytic murein transglycosylase